MRGQFKGEEAGEFYLARELIKDWYKILEHRTQGIKRERSYLTLAPEQQTVAGTKTVVTADFPINNHMYTNTEKYAKNLRYPVRAKFKPKVWLSTEMPLYLD